MDYLHDDLWDNFVSVDMYIHIRICKKYIPVQVPFISYDFVDGDPDPIGGKYDWHGTRCAGIVSAAKDNNKCGVGIAYSSNLAG